MVAATLPVSTVVLTWQRSQIATVLVSMMEPIAKYSVSI